MSVNLDRIVTDEQRAAIKDQLGNEWIDDEITVSDVIASAAGIGYGGHYDETSELEDAVFELIAVDPEEIIPLALARYEHTNRIRDAVEALPLIVDALGDAVEYREPLNIGCCPDNAMCEDHASDQAKADAYTALLHALTRTHQEAPDA